MNKPIPRFTTVHYGAAAFAAAFFSLVAVLAVIGGTTSAQETDASDIPLALDTEPAADDSIEVAAAPEVDADVKNDETAEKAAEDHFQPHRRGPDRRFGPPRFEDIDANNDNVITPDEFREFHANRPGPRDGGRMARGEFDGPPRGPRGHDEFRGGPGGRGHHGPPPHMRGGRGGDEFRGGPGGRGHRGPPPHMRDGHGGPGHGEFRGGPGGHDRQGSQEFERGPRGPRGGGEFGPPPRPKFEDLDANGDGSISEREFEDFRPPRGPRGPRGPHEEMPREGSF
jgi:hypothetical protein